MNGKNAEDLLKEARRVLRSESKAIERLSSRLGADFVKAVEILAGVKGRAIVSGIGKSGIIGRKIAATFTSTGTPATFLHPVEGLHGDLGIVGRKDVAVLISKSGDTSELAGLIDYLIRMGVPIIALTGTRDHLWGRPRRWLWTVLWRRKRVPWTLLPLPPPPLPWPWGMPWRWSCFRDMASTPRISPGFIRVAPWGGS